MNEFSPVHWPLTDCMKFSPSPMRLCVSMICASACCAQGSLCRRPPCHARSARRRRQRVRIMRGELSKLNRGYCPSLSEARSRACSACSAIARGRSPATQVATALTKRCSRGVSSSSSAAQQACSSVLGSGRCSARSPPQKPQCPIWARRGSWPGQRRTPPADESPHPTQAASCKRPQSA